MTSPYETVVVDLIIGGDPVRWTYPAARNCPTEFVRREIEERLRAARVTDFTHLSIQYPAGPWTEPLDRDIPVIGADLAPQPPRLPAPPQPAAPAAQPGFTPLPGAAPKPAGAPRKELAAFLGQLAARHHMSGADLYHTLALAMADHSAYLVDLERGQRKA